MRLFGQVSIANGRTKPWGTYSALAALAAGLIAVYAGRAISRGQLTVLLLLLAGLVGLVMFDRLSLAGWCGLILASAVVSRALVSILGLPSVFNFVHYPLVLGFAAAAAARPPKSDARVRAPAGRWLVGLLALAIISLVANWSHPLRAAIFLVIVGEPLLLVWAIQRWDAEAESGRRIALVAGALLAIQIPIGLAQGLALGWEDPVQGTLLEHGAGAHVLGGLFALGLLVALAAVLARRISRPAFLLIGAACVGMMIASGAMQVVFAISVALVGLPLVARTGELIKGSRRGTRGGSRLVAAVIALVLAAAGLFLAEAMVPGIIERAVGLANVKELPEAELVVDRARSEPLALFFGSGPGTSASRASILLNPELQKEDSPLVALDLPPTELGREVIFKTRDPYGGSAEGFTSSALGIIGDLGLLGFAGLILGFVHAWRVAARTKSWLRIAAQASLLMTGILIFVDNWLEYPEFAVPLGIVLGFGTSRRFTGEMQEATAVESEARREDEGDYEDESKSDGNQRVSAPVTPKQPKDVIKSSREKKPPAPVFDLPPPPPEQETSTADEEWEHLVAQDRARSGWRPERRAAGGDVPSGLPDRDRLISELQRVEAQEEASSKLKAEQERLIDELNAERQRREETELALERQRLLAELGAERQKRDAAEHAAEREQLMAQIEAERERHEQTALQHAAEREQLMAQTEAERDKREQAAGEHAEEKERLEERVELQRRQLLSQLRAERQRREQAGAEFASERERLVAQIEAERDKREQAAGEHALERQHLISQIEAEHKKGEQAAGEHAAERQRLISQIEAERDKREQAVGEHAAERERLISQIEAERKKRGQAAGEHAAERQRLVSEIEAERKKRKEIGAQRRQLVSELSAERRKRKDAETEHAAERERLVAELEAQRARREEPQERTVQDAPQARVARSAPKEAAIATGEAVSEKDGKPKRAKRAASKSPRPASGGRERKRRAEKPAEQKEGAAEAKGKSGKPEAKGKPKRTKNRPEADSAAQEGAASIPRRRSAKSDAGSEASRTSKREEQLEVIRTCWGAPERNASAQGASEILE